jgi:type IV pilus assembly protein PilC
MPLFHYGATDRTGKPVVGSMQAGDAAGVSRRLQSMGYTLTGLHPSATTSAPRMVESPVQVSQASRARFLRQLASTQRAGIPLYQSLTEIQQTVADRSMAGVVQQIAARVEIGDRLSDALDSFPHLFSSGVVGLVAAAETGGFLDRALADLAEDAERAEHVRRQIGRALGRVRWTLGVYLFLGVPLAFFIGPMLRTLFTSGDRAQAIAAGVKAGLRQLLAIGLPLLVGGLGLKLLARRLAEWEALERWWDEWLLRLPVVGAVHGCQSRSEFLTTLARLFHAGLGPAQCWEAATGAVENRAARGRIAGALPIVATGGRFSEALAAAGVCTVPEAGLVANGELTGQVEESLARVAESYHWRLEDALKRLPAAAQTLGYVLVAPLVIFVIATFYRSFYRSIFQSMDEAVGS